MYSLLIFFYSLTCLSRSMHYRLYVVFLKAKVHCESKKGPLYFCPQLWQMLTDFRNFSIVEFIKKFATN